MDKVRVLAVAPYDSMREVIESVAAARDDIELTTFVGNVECGAALVQQCDQSNFDVIVSRGGTAQLIREITSLPVIEMELTPYDIQAALTTIAGTNKKAAVVGFSGISEAAATLCDILHYDVEIATIHSTAECDSVMQKLKESGVEVFLCDMVGVESGERLGFEVKLISSDVRGIETALNKAVSYFSSFGRAKLASRVHEAMLTETGRRVVVLTLTGQTIFASPECSVPPAERNLLCRLIPTVLNNGSISTTRPIAQKEYQISGCKIDCGDEQYIYFILKAVGIRQRVNIKGVTVYDNSAEDIRRVGLLYGNGSGNVAEQMRRLAKSGLPVLVCGARGTFPEAVAGGVCMQDILSERDCCVIDCSVVNASGWNKLLGDSGLISFRKGSSVLFNKLLSMSDEAIFRLIDFIDDAGLGHQLRLVFSMISEAEEQRAGEIRAHIVKRLYCAVLRLPSLCERGEELAAIIDCSFTRVCAGMGIKKPRIKPEAMELLLSYGWPGNHPQLQTVVTQLSIGENGEAVSAEDVSRAIGREPNCGRAVSEGSIDLSGTLEDIDERIVRIVLAEEGMNRSKTARRLGISRATLWRILGKDGEPGK